MLPALPPLPPPLRRGWRSIPLRRHRRPSATRSPMPPRAWPATTARPAARLASRPGGRAVRGDRDARGRSRRRAGRSGCRDAKGDAGRRGIASIDAGRALGARPRPRGPGFPSSFPQLQLHHRALVQRPQRLADLADAGRAGGTGAAGPGGGEVPVLLQGEAVGGRQPPICRLGRVHAAEQLADRQRRPVAAVPRDRLPARADLHVPARPGVRRIPLAPAQPRAGPPVERPRRAAVAQLEPNLSAVRRRARQLRAAGAPVVPLQGRARTRTTTRTSPITTATATSSACTGPSAGTRSR